jgi:hypothetical protein
MREKAERAKWKTEKGEKVKRGKGETENHGIVSERFVFLLHFPFFPFALFAPSCMTLFAPVPSCLQPFSASLGVTTALVRVPY